MSTSDSGMFASGRERDVTPCLTEFAELGAQVDLMPKDLQD